MEGHHMNIVCLCSIYHGLMHYGVNSEKENVLNKIYRDRAERLAVSGIKVSRREFETFAM